MGKCGCGMSESSADKQTVVAIELNERLKRILNEFEDTLGQVEASSRLKLITREQASNIVESVLQRFDQMLVNLARKFLTV